MEEKIKLGDIIKIMHGFAFKSENYVEASKYRLVTLGNFSEGDNSFKYNDEKATYYGADFPLEFVLEEGDLIMPMTEQVVGLFGNSAFIPKSDGYKFVLNQRVGKVICDESKADKKYIHYLLATELVKNQLEARASGTRQRNISPSDIYDVEVYLPNLATQQKIGQMLYDIELKQTNNNLLSSIVMLIANQIYDYWFVQYDFPDKNGKPYKASGGIMVWNDVLKKEIPKGWRVQTLKENELTKIVEPGVEKFIGNKIYLATANVENNSIVSGDNITYKNRQSRANMQPKENTVWFAKMKNSIKHIFVGEYSKEMIDNYIFSTGFLGLQCVDNKYLEYIICFINSDFFELQKDKLAHGATQEAVNNDDIRLIPIIIPDNETLEKFNNITKDIFKKIYFSNRENEELKSLRDFLLPLLMNGQVKL